MRELKFRVWDKYYKQYVKPYAVCLDGRAIVITEPSNDLETLDPERVIIEFGTGLKDKNGKEIYEGDILWADDWADDAYYRVIYDELRAGYVAQSVTESRKDDHFAGYFGRYLVNHCKVIDHCKVIGNIHEKPELLEQEDGGSR